jgi:hypothetical protein
MHLKFLGKQEQAELKSQQWKEIIKIRAEVNEVDIKRTVQITNETKSWFFEKINKTDV